MIETNEGNEGIWKILLWALAGYITIATASIGYLFLEGVQFDRRLVVIESSRCTVADCAAIDRDLTQLRARVDAFPKEIPPAWFASKVAALEQKLSSLERRSYEYEKERSGK